MATGPLIAIVGQTATGKTALAIEISKLYGGEIICADSRTVYRGMDIGTAKPSPEERRLIPHHLLDVADPDTSFTAADFKHLALEAMDDIYSHDNLPLLVGGSGLFMDAVLYDYSFEDKADPDRRAELQEKSVEQLQKLIHDAGLPLPTNSKNPRHLIRTIETNGKKGTKHPLRPHTLILGLQVPRHVLEVRVRSRVSVMIENGLLEEVRDLSQRYGWDEPAFQTHSMKAFQKYTQGQGSLGEAIELFVRGDLQLAKRQLTWFKRNQNITWVQNHNEALRITREFMSNYLLQ